MGQAGSGMEGRRSEEKQACMTIEERFQRIDASLERTRKILETTAAMQRENQKRTVDLEDMGMRLDKILRKRKDRSS